MRCQLCPAHRNKASLPAGLCAGGSCAGAPQRMPLSCLLEHRFVMLSALWMLGKLKMEIPEATWCPARSQQVRAVRLQPHHTAVPRDMPAGQRGLHAMCRPLMPQD